MGFDDEAFAITSAISKPAAVPMYNDERATDAKTRSKQALAVGEGSDELFWGTPKQCKKKSGRESFFGRRAAGGGPAAPDRRYSSYFYILQAPAEYKNDLGISGCGGNSTSTSTSVCVCVCVCVFMFMFVCD